MFLLAESNLLLACVLETKSFCVSSCLSCFDTCGEVSTPACGQGGKVPPGGGGLGGHGSWFPGWEAHEALAADTESEQMQHLSEPRGQRLDHSPLLPVPFLTVPEREPILPGHRPHHSRALDLPSGAEGPGLGKAGVTSSCVHRRMAAWGH